MAASFAQIRAALGSAVSAMGSIQATGYIVGGKTLPCADIYPGGDAGPIMYDASMGRGFDVTPFTVEVFVGAPLDHAAQVNLDAYLAPSGGRSIKAALEADVTLGSLVADLRVVSCTGPRPVQLPGRPEPLLSAAFTVEIFTHGV
jgi:hypothetical protein